MALLDGQGNPVRSGDGSIVQTGSDIPNDGPAGPRPPPPSWADFKEKAGSLLKKGADLLDPSKARMAIAGLLSGGANSDATRDPAATKAGFASGGGGTNLGLGISNGQVSLSEDWRVAISLPSGARTLFWRNGENSIMSPLVTTDGVIFPYTPNITVTHNARYGETKLTHSNYSSFFYEGSEVQAITISGEFTVQTEWEGRYLLAAIYFFRSATKMFFGRDMNPVAGTPPPMVTLDGYGAHYFPGVNCVITSFAHTMPADVDYVEIPTGLDGQEPGKASYVTSTRLPTVSTIAITLQPIYSRNQVAEFSLNDFSSGTMLKRGGFI